jgi:Calcineurin-like phosphoesterase
LLDKSSMRRSWTNLLSVVVAAAALAGFACFRAPLRGIDFRSDRDAYLQKGHIAPAELADEPVYRLILIGDGGTPGPQDETLALLGVWGDAHPERTTAVFLGDNVYPAGIQGAGPARARGEAILLQQLRATRARKIVIPGNHDWGYQQFRQGRPEILGNEQRLVDSHADLGASFDPRDGCPGPVALPVLPPSRALPGGVTLIAIDIYWWFLREADRPVCAGIKNTEDFISRLRAELDAHRGQNVIIVAHHPVLSGGPHGGYTRGFWADLGISIFYRFFTVQDMIEPTYHEMVRVIGEVLAENPPLAMVGGHDHSLQILEGGDQARLIVVSGASSSVSSVTSLDQTLFAHAHRGFIVFDFHAAKVKKTPGGVVVVNVVETGRGEKPVFSLALDLQREERLPQKVPAAIPSP